MIKKTFFAAGCAALLSGCIGIPNTDYASSDSCGRYFGSTNSASDCQMYTRDKIPNNSYAPLSSTAGDTKMVAEGVTLEARKSPGTVRVSKVKKQVGWF